MRLTPNLEVAEELRVIALSIALHHFQQLPGELEGRGLKIDAARGVGQHEAKVDVDDMPRIIQQQVAVVPVLDLEQVADEAVPSHALHKRILGVPAGLSPLHTRKSLSSSNLAWPSTNTIKVSSTSNVGANSTMIRAASRGPMHSRWPCMFEGNFAWWLGSQGSSFSSICC